MKSFPAPRTTLLQWFDERTGIQEKLRVALDEPIRGGARWAYVFGSILLFLFVVQVTTGIFLSLYYVPSADHAHTSVAFIQKAAPGGALIRGLHHYSASAMVVFAVLHLAQTFLYGAYKKRRELVWMVGGVMFLLILGFAFTGYLLPWDQAAYFGTKVGTSIAGEIPVVGPLQQRIMLGGTELTTLTLSRFFTAHVFLLPLGLGLLVVLHLYLFRKATPAGPFHQRDDARVERFYPKQMFKDSIAILGLFIALACLALYVPAELGPQADPSSDYLARPPWYFLPLFQLLKYFPGKLLVIPTVVLPGVLFTLIFFLPILDRREERHPLKRPWATFMLMAVLLGAVALGALSKYEDSADKEFMTKLQEQEEDQREFLKAPFEPQIVGAVAAIKAGSSPTPLAKASPAPPIYIESCAECHGERGEGGPDDEPTLIGITEKRNRTPNDLLKILRNSRSYGLKKPMPRAFPELSDDDKQSIVAWITSLKPN
ncbi:MAG TPA: cytochrome b N-terminal domain-containing protein [Blastocatellia bacterium]|nr:cytochrome b N-terminal domain-containing protein [Blastocatellia bacterium]